MGIGMLKLHSRLGAVLALSFCLSSLAPSFAAEGPIPSEKKETQAEQPAPPEKAGEAKETIDPAEARVLSIRERVTLTPEQTGALDAMAAIMRNNHRVLGDMTRGRQDARKNMNAAEDVRSYAQLRQVSVDGVKQLAVSFDAFYNMLSAEQKKAVDAVLAEYREKDLIWSEPYLDPAPVATPDIAPKIEAATK